jgi:thymidylate kinase
MVDGRTTNLAPCILSFDGPKGTGKTTLIDSLKGYLYQTGNTNVMTLCEKDLDPARADTVRMLARFADSPTLDLEIAIAKNLADGRQWISRNILDHLAVGQIALIDRWYPSDAAFRRLLHFEAVMEINRQARVSEPDLLVAVNCAAKISWERAMDRPRGLNSKIIRSFDEHEACTRAFAVATREYGWFECLNEGTVTEAVDLVLCGLEGVGWVPSRSKDRLR